MEIYLVGGAVRDRLLGRPVHERDWVVVGATPEALLSRGYTQVGKDFPVFLHPDSKDEYALARTERKSGRGYGGFVCDFSPDITLENDLLRRDLTINAIAEAADGTLTDPYGGLADLAARRLRHVSPAFREDPLRVLRVARFAARYAPLGFGIADETLALMRDIAASGELADLTPERVWKETERALGEDQPQVYFRVLRDCGALAVLFPEVDALFGVPQPAQHHPEIDTGTHTLMVLEQAARLSPEPRVRFAALVHDLGKADTPEEKWPSHHGHEESGVRHIQALGTRLRVPRHFQELGEITSRYHLDCHRVRELRPETLLKKLTELDALRRPERFQEFLLACEADARGRLGLETRDYSQPAYFLAALATIKAVDIKPLLAKGLQGLALAEALQAERKKALTRFKKEAGHDEH
jgi:tRNA nucleotidyltransferase (CCA-adding enzyme)